MKERIALCVGQPFPYFILPSVDGKELQLKNIVEKSKMTIIHFWASNSFERDIYQKELKALYKKYAKMDFKYCGSIAGF